MIIIRRFLSHFLLPPRLPVGQSHHCPRIKKKKFFFEVINKVNREPNWNLG